MKGECLSTVFSFSTRRDRESHTRLSVFHSVPLFAFLSLSLSYHKDGSEGLPGKKEIENKERKSAARRRQGGRLSTQNDVRNFPGTHGGCTSPSSR